MKQVIGVGQTDVLLPTPPITLDPSAAMPSGLIDSTPKGEKAGLNVKGLKIVNALDAGVGDVSAALSGPTPRVQALESARHETPARNNERVLNA